ncbi:MAG: hypothetical protein ACRDJJ_07625 [Actinomycetota bacterium]
MEPEIEIEKICDLSTTCAQCGAQMYPVHSHYQCPDCGYRDSCCF